MLFVSNLDLTQEICQQIDDNSDDKLCNKQICTVCEDGDTDSYNCICFYTSGINEEMIDSFIKCGNCNDDVNKIFEYYWDQQKSNLIKDEGVSFDSIYCMVWKKTIEQCQQLLINIKDKSSTLAEVETLSQLFINENKTAASENTKQCQKYNLSLQLIALCEGMHQCYPNSKKLFPSPHEWIPECVDYIALYLEIVDDSKSTEAANVILKVKESLKLKGDFGIIKNLANCVCK